MYNRKNNKKGKSIIKIFSALVAIACALTLFSACKSPEETPKTATETEAQTAKFVPPPFVEDAGQGIPSVPDEKAYLHIYKEGMSFSAYLYGNVEIIDGKADIYFTNPASNTLWMKARIFDSEGKIIAETGLIKPNEYIKTVSFNSVPKDGSTIVVRIMTYEPDTYYSGGAVPVKLENIKVS